MFIMFKLFTFHKLINFVLTLLIITVMLLMMALIGLILGGVDAVFIALLFGLLFIVLFPSLSPIIMARFYAAKPLLRFDVPELYYFLDQLVLHAKLDKTPSLFWVNSHAMFAFTLGRSSDAVIVLSKGLINKLELSEVVAVMAHETAHIMHRDLWLMSMTDLIHRLMTIFSYLGQIMVVMFLPAYLFWDVSFPWLGVAILIVAPFINALLQLLLSRIREYDADYTAAMLMGSSRPLALALHKVSHDEPYMLRKFFVPQEEQKRASILQTHPKTETRIKKLLAMKIPENIPKMF